MSLVDSEKSGFLNEENTPKVSKDSSGINFVIESLFGGKPVKVTTRVVVLSI